MDATFTIDISSLGDTAGITAEVVPGIEAISIVPGTVHEAASINVTVNTVISSVNPSGPADYSGTVLISDVATTDANGNFIITQSDMIASFQEVFPDITEDELYAIGEADLTVSSTAPDDAALTATITDNDVPEGSFFTLTMVPDISATPLVITDGITFETTTGIPDRLADEGMLQQPLLQKVLSLV